MAEANYDQYLSLDASALKERYCRVMARIANLHLELALVMAQERRAKTQTWIDMVQRGSSQREADKYADHAALEATTEVWQVKAEIDAAITEKDVIAMLLTDDMDSGRG